MTTRRNPRFAFVATLILLAASGVCVTFLILRMSRANRRIARNDDVQLTLADMESCVIRAGYARIGYLAAGDAQDESELRSANALLEDRLRHLEALQASPDNAGPFQRLKLLSTTYISLTNEMLRQMHSGAAVNSAVVRELELETPELGNRIREMRASEQIVLLQRRSAFSGLFSAMLGILAAVFAASLGLLWWHYRRLTLELNERLLAEQRALATQETLRNLSGRLLRLQDEERRRFSRELHDSLGQYLAVVKMNLDSFARTHPPDPQISDALTYLEQCITETRTISHLLHPPLLDEVGFASAARWYVDGFAKRSGLQVTTDIPSNLERIPRATELALFRVLQEGLTNIHRHSKSMRADVTLRRLDDQAVLRIRDYGKGIPLDVLQRFLATGSHSGVGLAGMRERVREQGGQFDIQSDANGTVVTATLPCRAEPGDPESGVADISEETTVPPATGSAPSPQAAESDLCH
jgi:signal transduction histidine kinase